MTPRVFIPQVPQHWDESKGCMVAKFDTIHKAEEFGRITILLDRNDDVWKPDVVIAKLRHELADFTDNDYLLPMGAYHFMMWAFAVAFDKVEDHVQTLHWHQNSQIYRVIRTQVF